MSLVEISALDVDSNSTVPLFLLCTSSSSLSSLSSSPLHLQLLDGSSLLEADVSSSHKPRALACSSLEYLAAVQSALSPSARGQQPRFDFRWSRAERTLTLMERAGFAMKFSSVQFEARGDAGDKWRQVLHQVAAQQTQRREETEEREKKVLKLEKLLQQKETLLEAALTAKQKEEDRLFRGFCAVLNGKKDEVRRLQTELDRAREEKSFEENQLKKKKKVKVAPPKRTRKATGAKLEKKTQEEEEDEDMSEDDSSKEDSGGESIATEDEGEDDEGNERKRAKRDAISAYSQLPASVKPSSVHISSAEDLLSSMDDIIKNEEEANEATQRGETSGHQVKTETVANQSKPRSSVARAKKAAAVKEEPTPPPKLEPVKRARPATPVDVAMNSDEEDILDMLL